MTGSLSGDQLCLAIIGPRHRTDGARQVPVAARRWQSMTVDVASCRRLNDVNESFQQSADEMVVHHLLIPLSETSSASTPQLITGERM